jgi:hypothetical protein
VREELQKVGSPVGGAGSLWAVAIIWGTYGGVSGIDEKCHSSWFRGSWKEQNWPPRRCVRDIQMPNCAPTTPGEAVGCIINAAQDAKTEILVVCCCVHPDRRFPWNSESGYSSAVS